MPVPAYRRKSPQSLPDSPPIRPASLAAFTQELQRFGWTADENVRIDKRWSGGDAQRIRRYATELAALAPDVGVRRAGVTDALRVLKAQKLIRAALDLGRRDVSRGCLGAH
jgi:hypothetical protein